MPKKTTGVTFVEVLITIAIVSILAGITSISFVNSQKKAKDEKKINDIQKIKIALEVYRSDNTDHLYPTASASFPPACGNDWIIGSTIYLQKFPCDGTTKYFYLTDTNNIKYSIRACLSDTQNTYKDTTNNLDPQGLLGPSHDCPAGTVSYTKKQP